MNDTAVKTWSWRSALTRAPLEANTKLVLHTLSTHMNDHGEGCYPSLDMLIEETSLARATLVKYLAKAEAAGFIKRKTHGYQGKSWARREYIATYPSNYEIGRTEDKENRTENQSEKGSSAAELPSPPQNIPPIYGGSPVEPPSPKAVQTATEGSSTDGVKAVQIGGPYKDNSPLNSSKNSSSVRAGARDDDDAQLVVDFFDKAIIEVFGEQAKRKSDRRTDRWYAHDFITAGASPEFCLAVFQQVMAGMKKRRDEVPQGLSYFKAIIPEQLSKAVVVDGNPYAQGQTLPLEAMEAQRASNYAAMRDFITDAERKGNRSKAELWRERFTPEKRAWLEAWEEKNGSVLVEAKTITSPPPVPAMEAAPLPAGEEQKPVVDKPFVMPGWLGGHQATNQGDQQ